LFSIPINLYIYKGDFIQYSKYKFYFAHTFKNLLAFFPVNLKITDQIEKVEP